MNSRGLYISERLGTGNFRTGKPMLDFSDLDGLQVDAAGPTGSRNRTTLCRSLLDRYCPRTKLRHPVRQPIRQAEEAKGTIDGEITKTAERPSPTGPWSSRWDNLPNAKKVFEL